jgi:hypothetical protein
MTDEERILDLALGDALEDIRRLNAENGLLREQLAKQEARMRAIGWLADLAHNPPYTFADESTGETD